MEIIRNQNTHWMDADHPNYQRWNRSRELSNAKGEFVKSIISQVKECKGLTILDLGSGEGGTSRILSENNTVISSDFDLGRLKRQMKSGAGYLLAAAGAPKLPFKSGSFDVIILQDVIEHIEADISHLPEELSEMLKPDGVIYISTPNKYSLFNFLSDPHWGLPFICAMRRKTLRKFVLPVFRKRDKDRIGIAQLLSYQDLAGLFEKHFEIKLNTIFAARQLFNNSKAIAWSNFHISIINALNKFRLTTAIVKFANDFPGILNKYITPSFYIILSLKKITAGTPATCTMQNKK